MYLANAYPNTALSAGALMAIAFVMVGTLAFWLIMVYVADRRSDKKDARRAGSSAGAVAAPGNEHGDAGQAPAQSQHGAAA